MSQTPIFDQLTHEFEQTTHKRFEELLGGKKPDLFYANDETMVIKHPIWAGLPEVEDDVKTAVQARVRVADVNPALPEYDAPQVVRSLGVPTGVVTVIAKVSKQELIDAFEGKTATGKSTVLPEHHKVTTRDLVEAAKREFHKFGKRGDKAANEENIPHETESSASPDDSA